MDLDPEKHKGMVFSQCGECNNCCDGSLFTVGFVPLIDFVDTAKYFPIIFQKIYGEFWPGMIYTLLPGLACPYLDRQKKRCTIYDTHRPVACHHFPFRFIAKKRVEEEPFAGFPYTLEMDERCPALEVNSPGTQLLNEDGSLADNFVASIGAPKKTDFVEETRDFCRKLDFYGLFTKKRFYQQTEEGQKITVVYHVIDKQRLKTGFKDIKKQYNPYIKAHLKSLKKPKELIESVEY
ncbi:MAG: SapC family protein [Magnetococcales bacterium]|nr:SapC family protein [Magnetococcales bacterium]